MARRSPSPPSGVPAPKRTGRGAASRRASRASDAVTLEDVAKIAGVSPITVSRVVNRPELVRADTVAHVQRVIARTGYVPNLLAGGLASRRSRLVAALVPTIVNSVFVEMVQSLTDTLWASRYQVLLGTTGYPLREEAIVTAVLSRRPDAVFIVGVNHPPESRRRLMAARIPVVEAFDLTATPIDMAVGFSHEKLGAAMAEFLVARGYRRIASVWTDDERALRRRAGFLDGLARHGLAEVALASGRPPTTPRAGREGLASILARGIVPDAVACSSDAYAHGVVAEAQARGLAIPDRLAVIGTGDLEFAADSVPALTTVRIDRRRIGRVAAEVLLARIEGRPAGPKVVDVGFEIVERETT
jgi:LacI family gluconate utilization system Gnt-I transcriptional repressor